MANVVIAYILWFFFGIFGVHHFYLKRDRQAFVWWATLGGLLGLGWIRDLWHIPEYVEEANALSEQQQNGLRPTLEQEPAAVDTDSTEGYVSEDLLHMPEYVEEANALSEQQQNGLRPTLEQEPAAVDTDSTEGYVSEDLLHMPEYVEEANALSEQQQNGLRPTLEQEPVAVDEDSTEGYVSEVQYVPGVVNEAGRKRSVKPSMSGARFGGMMAMGYILGYLVMFLFPRHWFLTDGSSWVKPLIYVLPPLAVAVGVHLVANIGRVQVSWKRCILGSGAGTLWLLDDPTNIGGCCLLSTFAVYFWGCSLKSVPRRHRRRKTCGRLSTLMVCGTLYLSLWGSALYFNATITTRDGDTIPLREALNNFFTSPAWTETKESLYLVLQHIKVNGWKNVFQQIVQTFDPQGEATAYKVLGVSEDASQEEVKARYRQLAKQWHPDKHQDPASKAQAQEKFLHIQKAYETLSNLKSRRSHKNHRQSGNDEF